MDTLITASGRQVK